MTNQVFTRGNRSCLAKNFIRSMTGQLEGKVYKVVFSKSPNDALFVEALGSDDLARILTTKAGKTPAHSFQLVSDEGYKVHQ